MKIKIFFQKTYSKNEIKNFKKKTILFIKRTKLKSKPKMKEEKPK